MCTLSPNEPPDFHPPGCDVAVSPQLFVFLFIIFSGLFAIYAATKHHPQPRSQDEMM